MLTCIDVKFIFQSVRLSLSSSAKILQIAGVFELSSCCFCYAFSQLFRLVPAVHVVLTLETIEVSAILVFTTKTTQPHPQVFSVNSALTCRGLHFRHHFLVKHKILPNFELGKYGLDG